MKKTIVQVLGVLAILAALGMSTVSLVASPGWEPSGAPTLLVSEGQGEGKAKGHVRVEKSTGGVIERAVIDADIQIDLVDPQSGGALETRTIKVRGLDLTEAGDKSKTASQFMADTLTTLDSELSNIGLVLDQPQIEGMEFLLDEGGSIISIPLQVNFRLTVTSTASTRAVTDALKGKRHGLSSGSALYDTRVRYTLEGLGYTEVSPDTVNMDTLVASIEAGIATTFPEQFTE